MTTTWSQDVFSKGELSPLLYSRVTVDGYYKALRLARNTITYPQGAVGKRFGSKRIQELSIGSDFLNTKYLRIASWTYLNQGTYILVFNPTVIDIFFQDKRIYSLAVSGYYHPNEIKTMDYSVLDNKFRIGTGRLQPKDIVRDKLTTVTVTSFTTNTLTTSVAASPVQTGFVQPVEFPTDAPTSVDTLSKNIVYYAYFVTSTTFELYFSPDDASARINKISFTSIAGTIDVNVLGKFNLVDMNIPLYAYPQYDFGDYSYNTKTFKLGAKTGATTLTASSALFDNSFIGGSFIYGSGVAFIKSIGAGTQPVTVANVIIKSSFDDDIVGANSVLGEDAVLLKRAWSNEKGWPKVFGSYQSRALCASTKSLPNGFWASSVKDYTYFNDTFTDDADPIGYYPASNMSSQINYIAAYRSLCVFTSNGVYSTPLSQNNAITPSNFALLLQEQTNATSAYPVGLDNRIVFVSGNDINLMDWDGLNNAYNTNIASIMSDHLIDSPVDQDVYVDLNKAGSRYCFIVNQDGTLVIFQSLSSEEVLGFTLSSAAQSYGNAYYRQVATTNDGHAYFIMERQRAYDSTLVIALNPLIGDVWNATGINLAQYNSPFVAVKLSPLANLPITQPVQVNATNYYYAVPIDANSFKLYATTSDAIAQTDPITIIFISGGACTVTPWPLLTEFVLEKMDQETKLDSYTHYQGAPDTSMVVGAHLNAQELSAWADGYEFKGQVYSSTFQFKEHGQVRSVSDAYVGFKITSSIEPLPLSLPGAAGFKQSSLVFPTHIRVAIFTFVDTIGGTINGTPIQMQNFIENAPGFPPSPQTGAFQMSIMGGWNEYKSSSIRFEHDNPYDFKLTGIFYRVEN